MAKINRPRIVLDTNIFLVSLVSSYKLYWVFEAIIKGKITLIISNEILTEYEEKITEFFGLELAQSKLDFLLLLPNVELIHPYFNWNLINSDKDDNKFVDTYIASNADYLITNDKDFNVLKELTFPAIRILSIKEFQDKVDNDST